MSVARLKSVPAPDAGDGAFYAAAEKIYPREISGRFSRLRRAAVIVLLGLFYGVAWLEWDGHQAILFDLPARKFHLFALTLWPQDFLYLALLLIIAALSLFFFTALAGRLWCGYACPQTVWTELFVWIEQWTEGTRSRRMKLDRGPWTAQKVLRKTLKQVLWVALAAWTGFTFVGYFTPIRTLGGGLAHLSLGPWSGFWVVLYGLATYGNAGFLREQVCKYMCPYARFQSAMFDKDTLIISYDPARGEPRGPRRRGTAARAAGLGDCIDCTLCVQVCPTGIDIRKGLQYECIACGACIDACDEVMDKMASPRGLIRYTTEHAVQGAATRLVRPRMLVYGALLTAGAAALVYSLFMRVPLILDVIRDRNSLYREVRGDRIENAYSLKVINLDDRPHSYSLAVSGMRGLELAAPLAPISVPSGSVSNIPARLDVPATDAGGVHSISLTLTALDAPGIRVRETSRFVGPAP
ncbi:MAG TPA: cytochrome c oxidase accessory protein CcoG [Steroidobacteraceae bacterium]|nr:cytochrome c oxidase accessory protein CcoG [Steroidobacteraceae bacterium]